MNKQNIAKAMPTVLFITGIVGIFVSEVVAARDTLKAEEIITEKDICRYKNVIYDQPDENGIEGESIVVPLKEYVPEVIKATWKCFIPTVLSTTATITCLVMSKRLTQKQILALSTAVASAGGLVTKYRKEIENRFGKDPLTEIDRAVAEATMDEAKPPVITTPHVLWTEQSDLADDGEYLFFDPFTKTKFRSTKLAVMGAKYYLNRNFQLGSEAPHSMFYAFLGLELPEEYSYAGWDISEMEDNGFYWIDIDCVKSDKPDPDTGEYYYILEYDMLPGDCDDNYYPFGRPLDTYGSEVRA